MILWWNKLYYIVKQIFCFRISFCHFLSLFLHKKGIKSKSVPIWKNWQKFSHVLATYPSKECPINCRLWHRHPHWFWRVTVFSSLQFKNCIKLKNKTTQTYSVNKNKVDQIPIAVSQIANLAVVKMSFSRFKGWDNFVIDQILTEFQHYNRYNYITHCK